MRIRYSGVKAQDKKNHVTIYFDRGKVTSTHCSCESGTSWCAHVIATAFERIRNKPESEKLCVRLPISDSLNLLSREKLLNFAKHLLCEYQNEPIVDTAQQLLDKLLMRDSPSKEEDDINKIAGAPDPTAGPGQCMSFFWKSNVAMDT